ncbi:MAG: helix-turn-helix domain-containing protein [Treponemataceae bacterium]|nr:helix-turn-helix domain-containing protein [Treponemataceae bacterium]
MHILLLAEKSVLTNAVFELITSAGHKCWLCSNLGLMHDEWRRRRPVQCVLIDDDFLIPKPTYPLTPFVQEWDKDVLMIKFFHELNKPLTDGLPEDENLQEIQALQELADRIYKAVDFFDYRKTLISSDTSDYSSLKNKNLSPLQAGLLRLLFQNENETVDPEQIQKTLWNDDKDHVETLYAIVHQLKNRLKTSESFYTIEKQKGCGYRIKNTAPSVEQSILPYPTDFNF